MNQIICNFIDQIKFKIRLIFIQMLSIRNAFLMFSMMNKLANKVFVFIKLCHILNITFNYSLHYLS